MRKINRMFTRLVALLLVFFTLAPTLFLHAQALDKPVPGKKSNDWRGWANDDPRWYNVKMNKCKELTLYHAGCAVISYTKLLIQADVKPETYLPSDMNTWMRDNGGFVKNKGDTATTTTNAYANWEAMAKIDSRVSYAGYKYTSGFKVDEQKKMIMDAVKDGLYVIVGVNGGGHWVCVDNKTSLEKGYPVIWDTAKKCQNPAKYNVGRVLFSAYGSTYSIVKYKITNVSFKIRFDANGGKGSMADHRATYNVQTPTPAASFTRPGYAFSHWTVSRSSDNKYYCKQENGTKEGWYLESEIPAGYVKKPYPDKYSFCWATKNSSEVITVHAEWKRIGNYFTVSYHPNGGKGTMEDTTVIYGVDTKLPEATFTKDGYGVAGWNVYRKSDGKWLYRRNNKAEGGKWCVKGKEPKGYTLAVYKNGTTLAKTSKVNGDEIQLYAVWKKAFTVEYDANGGTGAMEDTAVVYGQNTKIPQCTFTRDGYTFKGWNVYRESDGKWVYRRNNSTVNAKWCKEGQQPSGYTLGWYKDGTTVAKTSSVAGDTVRFVAVWEKVGGTAGSNNQTSQTPTKPKEEQKPTEPKEEQKPTTPKEEDQDHNSGTTNTTPPVEEQEKPVEKVCTLAVQNLYLPPAKLSTGSAFTVSGVVTSKDTITSVTIRVKDANTGKVAFSGTAQPNSKSYSLFNLDSKMTFSKLAAGKYVLEVIAKDSVGEKTLVKHEFTRVASNITSSNMVYPSGTLTKGKTFRVSGKVSSADKISKVELSVHTTDGKKMFSGTANPNAANYDVYGLDSKMTFKQLPAGKYIYRVAVTDGKGVTRYAVSMSFTVK